MGLRRKLTRSDFRRNVQRAIENTSRGIAVTSTDYRTTLYPNDDTPTLLKIRTLDGEVRFSYNDEPFLYVLCTYGYMPMWFVKQMYETQSHYSSELVSELIQGMFETGLAYGEATQFGMYLRPTRRLTTLMNLPSAEYKAIPMYTSLHDLSAAQFMWMIMAGTHYILDDEAVFPQGLELEPRKSMLGLIPGISIQTEFLSSSPNRGLQIYSESATKWPGMNTEYGKQKFESINAKIRREIVEERYSGWDSPELKNLEFLCETGARLVEDEYGTAHKEWLYHVPDLMIPLPRKNGAPQSIAVEMELSNKRQVGYEETVLRYADSIKFGKVLWMCESHATKVNLMKAWNAINEKLHRGELEGVRRLTPFIIHDTTTPMPNN